MYKKFFFGQVILLQLNPYTGRNKIFVLGVKLLFFNICYIFIDFYFSFSFIFFSFTTMKYAFIVSVIVVLSKSVSAQSPPCAAQEVYVYI